MFKVQIEMGVEKFCVYTICLYTPVQLVQFSAHPLDRLAFPKSPGRESVCRWLFISTHILLYHQLKYQCI